jgi:hypothetical protein
MSDWVRLYISAATDLELEREVLGKATVEIPTSLGWRIHQTPGPNEKLNLKAVVRADVHLLIMGGDIRAPVGAEWQAARSAGRAPILFLKQNVGHTPAATVFIHDLERDAAWRPYHDVTDLRRQVLKLLVGHILEQASRYQIAPREFDKLRRWQDQLASSDKRSVDQARGGAGASSVVLSAERFTPSEGKLIRPKPSTSKANSSQ